VFAARVTSAAKPSGQFPSEMNFAGTLALSKGVASPEDLRDGAYGLRTVDDTDAVTDKP